MQGEELQHVRLGKLPCTTPAGPSQMLTPLQAPCWQYMGFCISPVWKAAVSVFAVHASLFPVCLSFLC